VRLLKKYPRALGQVFVLMTGTWLATNMEAAVTPAQLKAHLLLSSKEVTLTMLVINASAALSYPLFGLLSQRIGRRRFYIGYGLAVLVVGSGAYLLLMTSNGCGIDRIIRSRRAADGTRGQIDPALRIRLGTRKPAARRD